MENAEILKNARNTLLKLHKVMIDLEREVHEGVHGPLTPGQFLSVLLENPDFAWLRKFSMLIVEIDEMFAAKDGVSSVMVDANLNLVVELVEMREDDEYFRAKYRNSIQQSSEAAALHSELRAIVNAS